MKNQFLKKQGITLIALVITIVILIILAGVSIAMLVGENGIITQTQQSKIENEKAKIVEKIQLEIADKQTENLGTINEDEFYEILGKYGTVSADETTLTTTKGNYELSVSDIYSGEIISSLVTTSLSSWEYTLDGENIILNKYIGTDSKIFIPDTFNLDGTNYATKLKESWTLGESVFANNTIIEKVKFGDNVQMLHPINGCFGLFYNCSSLVEVYNMPKDSTSYAHAFNKCVKLEKAPKIQDCVTSLSYTFTECIKLDDEIEIPESVIDLSGTFNACENLSTTIVIPISVTNMKSTFLNCKSLSNVMINAENVTDMTNCFGGDDRIYQRKLIIEVTPTSNTYQVIMDNIDDWVNVYLSSDNVVNVSCWGDSLTYGAGSSGISNSYPSVLSKLSNRKLFVSNMGVGGENSTTIAGRQGGIPIYLNSFIIPSATNPVEISFSNDKFQPALQGTAGLNPCEINGIKGNIIYSNEKYYFTWTEKGKSVTVSDGTKLITSGTNKKNDVMIIWAGQNDNITTENISNLISNIDTMIDYNTSKKYIVISLLYAGDEVNSTLSEKFGINFLDIRPFLSVDGDNTISSVYQSDDLHLNDDGYLIVAQQVYNKLTSLGYITE